jgi:hypothetical protein
VAPAVEAVIMRALDRSPTKRFLTVRQFVDEVTRVGHGEVIELKQTMAMGKAGRPKGELVQTLMGMHQHAMPMAPSQGATKLPAVTASATAPLGSGATAQAGAGAARAPGGQPMATSPAGPVGMTALTPAPGVPIAAPGASPWAPPAQGLAPQVAAPVVPQVAAPVIPQVQAPQVAAPQLAAPQVAGAAAGKKKASEDAGAKGKFRETMWFKKGELDAAAAQVAAAEAARTGKAADIDKADSLPIDERYNDDGSVTRGDKEKYSLRTGATQMMSAMPEPRAAASGKVSEDALIGEMKGGRKVVLAAIAVSILVIVGIIVLIAR